MSRRQWSDPIPYDPETLTIEDCRRWLIQWIRSGDERVLSGIRRIIANDLEDYYFPDARRKRKQQHRTTMHQVRAQIYSDEIKRIAAEQRILISEATLQVVKKHRLHSVEALERYISRGKAWTKTNKKMSISR